MSGYWGTQLRLAYAFKNTPTMAIVTALRWSQQYRAAADLSLQPLEHTQQSRPGSPSPSLQAHQCPIHPPETASIMSSRGARTNNGFLLSITVRHLEMSRDPPELRSVPRLCKISCTPALQVFSPQPRGHHAAASLLVLVAGNILSAPS